MSPGFLPKIMDAVLHHHEFLDGTGYPHGRAISDFVRLLTIVDIFAALIEGRCYKSAPSCDAAYRVLLDMGSRLDSRLVGEFRAVLPMLTGVR